MRKPLILFFLAVACLLPAWASDPGEPLVATECEAWAIHGYRIGMSQEDAASVRPMKLRGSKGWKVREKGEFEGFLQFDDNGLRRYAVQLKTGGLGQKGSVKAATAKSILRERFGKPTDTVSAQKTNFLVGVVYSEADLWTNEICDSLIAVESVTGGDSQVSVTQPNVYLRRLSDWKQERSNSLLD